MEIENLASALEATLILLRQSESSIWTKLSVEEIVTSLEAEWVKARNSTPIDSSRLQYLFAPTGPIQETSIDNGWGKVFLEIAAVVDRYTAFS